MINKKNLLGKVPFELGDKDAIHVAIVSVRAGVPIKPGERCKMNEFGEAVPGDGPGVADPFREPIGTGDSFWLVLALDEVPNVRHQLEHPQYAFTAPTREVQRNRTIQRAAAELGVTYEQLMAACEYVVEHDDSATYPGTLNADGLEAALDKYDSYDVWYEWSEEASHEFENQGSACCPEYNYPETQLFKMP